MTEERAEKLLKEMVNKTFLVNRMEETVTSYNVTPVEARITTSKQTYRIPLQELGGRLFEFKGPLKDGSPEDEIEHDDEGMPRLDDGSGADIEVPENIIKAEETEVEEPAVELVEKEPRRLAPKKHFVLQLLKEQKYLLFKKDIVRIYRETYNEPNENHAKYDINIIITALKTEKLIDNCLSHLGREKYWGSLEKFSSPGVPKEEYLLPYFKETLVNFRHYLERQKR